jgi:hypothetical protein
LPQNPPFVRYSICFVAPSKDGRDQRIYGALAAAVRCRHTTIPG